MTIELSRKYSRSTRLQILLTMHNAIQFLLLLINASTDIAFLEQNINTSVSNVFSWLLVVEPLIYWEKFHKNLFSSGNKK